MSYFPEIIHHGGAEGVTGSCHELRLSDQRPGGLKSAGILIDCGLFQGKDQEEHPDLKIDFPLAHIKALIVTHVHIDHVGRIPYLLAAGFKGPIFCSEPSALLLPLVLEDAVKVGFTDNRWLIDQFVAQLKAQIVPLPCGRWQPIETGFDTRLAVKFRRAGHILGSVYIECKVTSSVPTKVTRIIFSGDLGAPYAPLIPAPRSPYQADMVVLESTYGDRIHEGRRERRWRLRLVIEKALHDRGVILIPAFSIGRTQELLYELEEIIHRQRQLFAAKGVPWEDLEIIVDSPLASRFTEVYRQLRPFWDAEAQAKLASGRHPLSFEQLTTIDNHQDHLSAVAYLKKNARPCVVIAASGMCAGGRIVNYLKALLGDTRTDVVFVGYQAGGTPGRDIQNYGPGGGWVRLDGERYPIRAGIHTLGGYSAHADQQNLVNFIRRMRHLPQRIRLVHGEAEAKAALKNKIEALGEGIEVDFQG
jgi:metallo-beta-lactamase family protein